MSVENGYQDLIDEFQKLTEKTSRFRRVAVHVHSPNSYDFGRGLCNRDLNERTQYLAPGGEELYLSCLEDKFDLVAITDHMKAGYACRLAKKAAACSDVCVLPGIELSIRLGPPLGSLRLHLLAIFPEGKSIGEIERLFPGSLPDDERRTGQEEIKVDALADFVRRLRLEHHGLCIAAHVDNDNGIRMLFRQTGKETLALFDPNGTIPSETERSISESFKEYLVSAQFDGIEVRKPSDRQHYTWETRLQSGIKHHVPVFLTFDAHTVEELSKSDRVTYVKMAEVSWQGLANAIQFPHTRIRFSDERVPPPHIVGIEILSPEKEGFFPELRLGFGENLNCIIGPRGSGKSTVVDAFRYAFGYNRTLEELDSKDLANAVVQRQERNLKNCIIRVAYRISDDELHILEATYDSQSSYSTKVYDVDGNPVLVTDVERDGRYPLRLFGWSEIETLGRDPARQRDLLDKLVAGLSVLQDQRKYLCRELSQNSRTIKAKLDTLEEILQSNDGEVKNYKQYREGYDKLNTPQVQELFANLDEERERHSFLQKLQQALRTLEERIREALPLGPDKIVQDAHSTQNLFLTALDVAFEGMLDTDSALRSWWHDEMRDSLEFPQFQHKVGSQLRLILQSTSGLSSRVSEAIAQTNSRIEDIGKQIRRQVSADPGTQVLADLRDEAKKRLERVQSIRDKYSSALAEVRSLLEMRERTIEKLSSCHGRISTLRQAKETEIEELLNEFQTEGMVISIDFVANGDRDGFLAHLCQPKLLSRAHNRFRNRKWPELIAQNCTPVQFAQSIFDQKAEDLCFTREIDGKKCEITLDHARRIIQALYPFDQDQVAEVQIVDEEKLGSLLEIQEIDWDDSERILRNGQPVDESSPGQRSSAMLPLIALAESVPLLIDQPEDNLDNRLVGNVLVDILANLKEKRQIIVATHNPNIVVLGDAEQVAVLDAVNDSEGKVEQPQASLDHPFITKNVIELLEGGKEAFETRRKRYQEGQ